MRASFQMMHTSIETVRNARREWTLRSSLRLILEDDRGLVGVGEAAPLPGVSPDTAREAREALEAVRWPDRAPSSLEQIGAVLEQIDPRVASARFAAETALASMAATQLGDPLWALFADEVEEIGLCSALFSDDPDQLEAIVAEAAAFEVPALKLKIGADLEADRARMARVRRSLPDIELRLDANGSLRPDALPAHLAALEPFGPSFLEEASDLSAVLALSDTPFPLGIDESLVPDPEGRLDQALACAAIGVVVLKPTVLGGLTRCWELAQKAQAEGRVVVVSHAFEGIVARAAAAHLALAIGGAPAGLGEHAALDLLSDGLVAGWIDVAWIEPPELPGLGLDVVW